MTLETPYAFHRQIEKLFQSFLALGANVENRVRRACEIIQTRDHEAAMELVNTDYEIDEAEIDIEEECLKILALYQPVARDLRLIIAIIKINNEIERIADYAVSLARRAAADKNEDGTENFSELLADYQAMSQKVLSMFTMSLDALSRQDIDLAHEIFHLDDQVDNLRNKAYRTVVDLLNRRPGQAARLIDLYILARHLERIADRATNIAEEVVYLVAGEIARGTDSRNRKGIIRHE